MTNCSLIYNKHHVLVIHIATLPRKFKPIGKFNLKNSKKPIGDLAGNVYYTGCKISAMLAGQSI
jgi:hypothetical protein